MIATQKKKRNIRPGSIILSDCWKAYCNLDKHGYVHDSVNHSKEFVSAGGAHTQNIESTWHALKGAYPRRVHKNNCMLATLESLLREEST